MNKKKNALEQQRTKGGKKNTQKKENNLVFENELFPDRFCVGDF